MDANLATLLGILVTSLTTIIITLINMRKADRIETKVDTGNAVTDSVHTLTNGRNEKLTSDLAAANKEIQRLSLLMPPPPPEKP